MTLFNKKSIHKIITLLSSSSLILLILLTGTPPTVDAVYLSPGEIENTDVMSGSTVIFRNVTLTIRANEQIPINFLEFTVFNSLNDQIIGSTSFEVYGTKISDTPTGSFQIDRTTPLIGTSWYGYGYNYGYDEHTGYGYDFDYDFGYGYGNASLTDITIMYDITFTSSIPGTFYATFAANCSSYEFKSDSSSIFYVSSQYPPIPQKEEIFPNSLSAFTGTVNLTYDFDDLEDDLEQLTLQIAGPAPYNSEEDYILWTFSANDANPMEDWTTLDIQLAQDMGLTILYDSNNEAWMLTLDTLKNWSIQNPWNQSINSSVWPSGGYNFSIEVADADGNTWGSIAKHLDFSTYRYSIHSIQPVINSAHSKETVYVLNGTFNDSIIINKNIHLLGSGSSIIQPNSTPQSGIFDVKLNQGSSGTIIEHLIFDFNGENNTRSGTGLCIGQAGIVTSDITIKNNIFYPGNLSGVGGYAIQTVTNSDISDLSIRYNKIIGNEQCNANGIIINPFYGPGTVEIYKNVILGNVSYGVSIQSSHVKVSRNEINNSGDYGYSGIRFFDSFGGLIFTDVILVSNSISQFNQGIEIGNPTSVGSTLIAEILSNTISHNNQGIIIRFDAILQNSIHFNNIIDNLNFGLNNLGSALVNATLNWWGDSSGPYHSSNPSGIGNPVSNNILFSNWLPIYWNNTAWVDDNYDNATPGWGIDHFNTTTDGINAVFDGGFVNLNPGTYDELLSIDKPLTLQAKYLFPDSTIITDEGSTYGEFIPFNGQTIQIESNDVTIHGLKIMRVNDGSVDTIAAVGNNHYPDLYNITISNCSIHSIYDGFYLQHVDSVLICHSNITSDQSGIHYHKVNSSLIVQNQLNGIDSVGLNASNSNQIIMSNNTLKDSLDAMQMNLCKDIIIHDCYLQNNTNGLFIKDSEDVIVIDSNFSENQNGITLFGLSIATIENNSFYNNTWNLSHAAQVENGHYYGSIQNAILHAGIGNQVHVFHGLYEENVIIDKRVKIQGIDPVEQVIIDGRDNGPAISVGLNVNARNVNIIGLSLNSSSHGIKSGLYKDVSGLLIQDCIIQSTGDDYAVHIDPHQYSDYPPIRNGTIQFANAVQLKNNIIRGGLFYQYDPFELYGVDINKQLIIEDNDIDTIDLNGSIAVRINNNLIWSITASGSYDLSIQHNQIINDPGTIPNGINLWSIENESTIKKVTIHNNSIYGFSDTGSSTGISGVGIVIAGGDDITVDTNDIYATSKGIYVSEDFTNKNNQLCRENTSDLVMSKNNFELGQTAIMLTENVTDVEIISNNFSNNGQGIWLRKAMENIIAQNRFYSNYYGVRIDSNSSNNLIYDNYFSENDIHARDMDSVNIWNVSLQIAENIVGGSRIGGNYWDTYGGMDTDGDYIGDTLIPFTVNDNIVTGGDYLPLMIFDKTPPMVNLIYPNGGEVINTSTTILWEASDNHSDIDSVNLYYSRNQGDTWTLISDDEDNDGEYSWDLSEIPFGDNYRIKVEVFDVAGNSNNDTSDSDFAIDDPTTPGITIEVLRPIKGWVYFFNNPKARLFQRQIIILGHINIKAEIESSISLNRTEFLIDDQLVKIFAPDENNIYEWKWDEDSLFYHTITIRAYDDYDNVASKSINVFIFNFGIIP